MVPLASSPSTFHRPAGLRPASVRPKARRHLDPRQGNRVFPVSMRATVEGGSYGECCGLNRSASGEAISKQAHGIMPQIRSVDQIITPAFQRVVREAHSEVSFVLSRAFLLNIPRRPSQVGGETSQRMGPPTNPVRFRFSPAAAWARWPRNARPFPRHGSQDSFDTSRNRSPLVLGDLFEGGAYHCSLAVPEPRSLP